MALFNMTAVMPRQPWNRLGERFLSRPARQADMAEKLPRRVKNGCHCGPDPQSMAPVSWIPPGRGPAQAPQVREDHPNMTSDVCQHSPRWIITITRTSALT